MSYLGPSGWWQPNQEPAMQSLPEAPRPPLWAYSAAMMVYWTILWASYWGSWIQRHS